MTGVPFIVVTGVFSIPFVLLGVVVLIVIVVVVNVINVRALISVLIIWIAVVVPPVCMNPESEVAVDLRVHYCQQVILTLRF